MDIQVVDFASENAPEVFTKSLKQTGFAVLTNHPVEDGLIEEVYQEWREFLKYLGEERQGSDGDSTNNSADNTSSNGGDPDATPATLTPASTTAADSDDGSPEVIGNNAAKGELRFGNMTQEKAVQKPSGIDEPMFDKQAYKKLIEVKNAGNTENTTELLSGKYLFDAEKQDGYFPASISEKAKGANVKDLKHYYHCYFPHGRYPAEVSQRAKILGEKMLKLGRELVKWIDDNMSDEIRQKLPENMRGTNEETGEKRGLADWVSAEQTLLRVLHYPAYKKGSEEPGAIRAAAHEDINCITVLPAGSTKGLQVKCPKTGEWFDVPCIRGSLVINIGDMLQEASQREYISTTHRVVKPDGDEFEGVDRMATPCFIHFKPETYLSDKYPTAQSFLFERLRELGVMK